MRTGSGGTGQEDMLKRQRQENHDSFTLHELLGVVVLVQTQATVPGLYAPCVNWNSCHFKCTFPE